MANDPHAHVRHPDLKKGAGRNCVYKDENVGRHTTSYWCATCKVSLCKKFPGHAKEYHANLGSSGSSGIAG